MIEFLGRGRFEGKDLASLGIDSGHDVLDGAIFAGRIHGLKNQQQRPLVLGVEFFLQLGQLLGSLTQQLLRFLFEFMFEAGGIVGLVILEAKAGTVSDAVFPDEIGILHASYDPSLKVSGPVQFQKCTCRGQKQKTVSVCARMPN